jgi:hypothetical protein
VLLPAKVDESVLFHRLRVLVQRLLVTRVRSPPVRPRLRSSSAILCQSLAIGLHSVHVIEYRIGIDGDQVELIRVALQEMAGGETWLKIEQFRPVSAVDEDWMASPTMVGGCEETNLCAGITFEHSLDQTILNHG